MICVHLVIVIPGRERQRANPESTIRSAAVYGFRVGAFGASRNDKVDGPEHVD